MNKLQLYITKSLRGYKNLVNFNPSEDVSKYVCDVRDALQVVEYDPCEKNIFYMLRYIPDGVFVTILRTIPDKPLDHLAAWVYVPNGLEISASQLEDVIRTVSRKVSGSGVSEADVAELRRLFSTEYHLDREAPSIVAMTGDSYAFSYYATETRTLSDFFGDKLFQPEFRIYKGVLLLDANIGIAGTCTDITGEDLCQLTTVTPPDTGNNGFTPYIYGEPFNRPFLASIGRELEISWRRPGFTDQQQIVTVTADGFHPECIETGEALKTINSASFLITSQDTKEQLTGCTIKVNGREITGPSTFTQSELSQAQVWVGCDGYFPYSARIDLAGTTLALIQMQERRKVYQFEMPLKSTEYGGPVKFEIRTKKELKDSPIDGYQVLDELQEGPKRTNYLGYNYGAEHSSLWQKGMYAAIGLVAGVALMLTVGRCTSSSEADSAAPAAPAETTVADTKPSTEPAAQTPASDANATVAVTDLPETQPKAEQTASSTVSASDEEAIAYLDSTKQWDRTTMEKYPLLRGLWDDMNTYKLKELSEVWAKKLSKSQNFRKVADAAAKGLGKRTNLSRHKSHTPTFNPATDNVIGFVGWTYYVDP